MAGLCSRISARTIHDRAASSLHRSASRAISTDRLAEMAAEIERLRARVAELEAIVTVGHGTMGTLEPDEPATITHNVPPNAPR